MTDRVNDLMKGVDSIQSTFDSTYFVERSEVDERKGLPQSSGSM